MNEDFRTAVDGAALDRDVRMDCDVAIVGSGAGGGTAAEILSGAGLRVVIFEEGPLMTSRDFHMLEREAYPNLYQESAGRRTKDKGITILQGRSVGGSTTVNWTSSFRTPEDTLTYWQERYGLHEYSSQSLAPWFAAMERRLNVLPWAIPPNENNAILARGAASLGIPTAVIPRNVKGCRNLGYCGMGCPVNAKQSMLVTTIPAALQQGARLYSRVRVAALTMRDGRCTGLIARALGPDGVHESGHTITVRAGTVVAAGGAINTPALLLRSALPDPHSTLGKRTFLHPVVISAAVMPDVVGAYSGAPQSIYSDHFLHSQPIDGPIGYKLEVPPLHPILMATTSQGMGVEHERFMQSFANTQIIIALMRDGFHPESAGGVVSLHPDGSPLLDYPITGYVWDGARRALRTMAQIQFAAGARSVMPIHESAGPASSLEAAQDQIDGLPMEILRTRVVSAHVMGGCAMGADPASSVVDADGRYHHLENLYVFDGSVFPTSLGANPQLSIYGIVARNASALARKLTGSHVEVGA